MHFIIEKFLSFTLIRFLISGGLSAVIHIGTVFILSHVLSVWYLYATTIGFISAVGFNFVMQKFFTFRDGDTNALRRQFFLFFTVASMNLIVNGTLMFFFVERVSLAPILAQISTSVIIAVWSYIVYGKLFNTENKISR